jgi:peroxiredoxin
MVSNNDMILMFVSICHQLNAVCSVKMFIHTEEIKSYGVDEVYCLSVNDAFVMRQVCTRMLNHVAFCSEKCNDVCLCACVCSGVFTRAWLQRTPMTPILSTQATSSR